MKDKPENKEGTLTFRTGPKLRAALKKIAVEEDRKLARVVVRILNKALKISDDV